MRAHYHIIVFSIAIICFCFGGIFYFNFKNKVIIELEEINNETPFKKITFTENLPQKSIWDKPKPQSAGEEWLFQVFTPPKIWIDEKGGFSAEALTAPVPFGIDLVSFEREKYRYKFLSLLGERTNPTFIILFDNKTGEELRVRQKKDYDDFRITEYKITKKEVIGSNINKRKIFDQIPTIEIIEKTSGTIFNLIFGEDTYRDQFLIGLKSLQPSKTFFVKHIGDSFNTDEAEYVIEGINSIEKSIRILKRYRNSSGKTIEESETLFLDKEITM